MLTLRTESHLMVVRQLPSHRLTWRARGSFATWSPLQCSVDTELAADLAMYMLSFATRRVEAAGEVFLLAGLLLVSLAAWSENWRRNAERERDRVDVVDAFNMVDCDDCDLDLDRVDMLTVSEVSS